ncbi:MAG TPA: GAF domain-containing protein [Myxococcales bacterium]|jgi:GAF domain-containing protein|nr:GAF domain-containing protein [Myxococcales bacterium]
MAETVREVASLSKKEAWAVLLEETAGILEGVHDEVTAMATISSLVHHGFHYLWTGFYRVVTPGKLLRVGPYQGTLGCLEIAFGKGVCGTAASERRTIVVRDVHAFPGHIACDSRSLSEIVAPVFDKQGELIAVFDIDSEKPATFDEDDRTGVEKLLAWFAR